MAPGKRLQDRALLRAIREKIGSTISQAHMGEIASEPVNCRADAERVIGMLPHDQIERLDILAQRVGARFR
ncbi:hypothetical protein ACPWR0_11655 [Pandoraea pneumonica]|uniref:hypothetical protein n=1 Tax=Pandoraea pneumonica TaxID=2508299 RepID=UPI003CE80FC5